MFTLYTFKIINKLTPKHKTLTSTITTDAVIGHVGHLGLNHPLVC